MPQKGDPQSSTHDGAGVSLELPGENTQTSKIGASPLPPGKVVSIRSTRLSAGPDYQAPPAYEAPEYEQSEYAEVDYAGVAEPLGDDMYAAYDDIASRALPTSNKQPAPDGVHPNAAGIAELPAGEDRTYENHDIEQQRQQSEEQPEDGYGVVLIGTIRPEPNHKDDGIPEANAVANSSQNASDADIFTRQADGSVRLRPAQRGKPVALRQASAL